MESEIDPEIVCLQIVKVFKKNNNVPFGAGSCEFLVVARLNNGAAEKSSLKERLVAIKRHEA